MSDIAHNTTGHQKTDHYKIMALVDTQIMPNVNFQRMTASAVGPAWRQAPRPQRMGSNFTITSDRLSPAPRARVRAFWIRNSQASRGVSMATVLASSSGEK